MSFFSFFMAVLWSSLFFCLLSLLQKNIRFIRHFGITTIFIIYLGCILRFLLPLEFSFTKAIPDSVVYAAFYDFFCLQKFGIGSFRISLMELLSMVSILAAVLLAVRFFGQYFPFLRIASMPEKTSVFQKHQLERVLKLLPDHVRRRHPIRVLYSSQVAVPAGIGLQKRIVLLPCLEYTDAELYYILLHEFTHFSNGDLYVKMGVTLLCILFWWNPFVYLLRRNLDEVLEIKCDLCATGAMTSAEKADYLSVIISSLERAPEVVSPMSHLPNARLIDLHKKELLKKRFILTASSENNRRSLEGIVARSFCILLAVITFLFSYSFVLRPSYTAPAEEIVTDWTAYEMTPENTSIFLDDTGQYFIICHNHIRTKTVKISKTYAEMLLDSGFQMKEGENK